MKCQKTPLQHFSKAQFLERGITWGQWILRNATSNKWINLELQREDGTMKQIR